MKAALAGGSPQAKASEFVVYPDAPHAFHADYRASYRKEAAEDGWKRALAWPPAAAPHPGRLFSSCIGRAGFEQVLRHTDKAQQAMTLVAIILATLAAGIGSVWLAALLMRLGLGGRADSVGPQHLLSLAAGALLATAFMHLLPEAFESQAGAHDLFATLLVGVVFFFLLDKAELWHHGHEHSHAETAAHSHAPHGHGHAHDHSHGHAHHHHHG
eukprot:gene32857-55403_t